MTMMRQDQMSYYIPPQQFEPTQRFGAVAQVPQIWPQPSLAEIIVDILGKLVVAGAVVPLFTLAASCCSERKSRLRVVLDAVERTQLEGAR